MHALEFVTLFTSPLEQHGMLYMVTGSVAAIVYGEPRLTHDVDLVVHLHRPDIAKLVGSFPLDHFYCPPEYVIVRKLQFYREGESAKHIEDCAKMLWQQGDQLDMHFLATSIGRWGLSEEWALVQKARDRMG